VAVLRIDREDGQPLACLLNYACHPTVLGPGNKLTSPDYPGHARRIVEQMTGAMCVFLQGAAGDMGPVETFVPDVAVARRLGTRLGLEAARVWCGLEPRPVERRLRGVIASGAQLAEYEEIPLKAPPPGLAFASETVDLPTRPFAEVYEQAPQHLKDAEDALAELKASGADARTLAGAFQRVVRQRLRANRMRRYGGRATLPVECHAIRLGESAIAAIAGEPYSEIGVKVKQGSPFPNRTLFAGYVGGDMMYIPTAQAFAFDPPAMQVDNSPYGPEAAAIATNHLARLLDRVAATSGATR
jgi:hypothetical protein